MCTRVCLSRGWQWVWQSSCGAGWAVTGKVATACQEDAVMDALRVCALGCECGMREMACITHECISFLKNSKYLGVKACSDYTNISAFFWILSPCFSEAPFFSLPHPLEPSVYQASCMRCKAEWDLCVSLLKGLWLMLGNGLPKSAHLHEQLGEPRSR